jgi:CarboxypepD_reg-like domain
MTTLKVNNQWCCFILLLLLNLPAYTQTDLSGKVVDEKNNAPLAGASVYFNNTTIGTYTNPDGDFHFEAIRTLNTEIVISCPGYEILVYKPEPAKVEGKRIVFKLQAKALPAVNKMLIAENEREKYLALFYQFFLGVTEEADNSKIINESSIYFTRDDSSTILRIAADTPLVIMNYLLGYKINYDLEEFWFDDATGENHFSGYARYEELGDSKKWIRNRERCYYGSTLHFYRSLVTHQLYEEGFGTFLMKPLKNTVAANWQTDSVKMKRPDSMVVEPLPAQNILFIDSTNKLSISIAGKLLVQYDKDPPAKYFLIQQGFMDDYYGKGVESAIRFKQSPTGINYAGVLDDYSNVEYSGYWIYEKVANRLPYNYKPVKH